MRTLRTSKGLRGIIWVVAMAMAWLQVSPVYAATHQQEKRNAQIARWQYARSHRSQLPAGLTQTPDAALQKKIAAKEAAAREAAARPVADVRPLSLKEMQAARGRGAYRNPYFNGTLPWQKSFRDVNMCNGNLFKSFTDMQIAPARGAGLVLQRTYNSNDARVGPFGVGWTHAYDIRIQEAKDVQQESGNGSIDQTLDDVPRTDFFGAKHTYHRDADGLYSPPPYLFDETSSDYDTFLASGPTKVLSDTEKGMDGTIKHYISTVTLADGTSGNERACDYIQDRHGNTTVLTYGQTIMRPNGSARKLLTGVTDPSGRSLAFTWANLNAGNTGRPAWRITQVQGPLVGGQPVSGVTYRVVYSYYTDATSLNAANELYNLKSVTLDPDGLSRTTTYTYTSCGPVDEDGNLLDTPENGLLASISDPLGHTVSYGYGLRNPSGWGGYFLTGTIWVNSITEPGGVDGSGNPRTKGWILIESATQGAGESIISVYELGDSGSSLTLYVDSFQRVMWLMEDHNDTIGMDYGTWFDNANNVIATHCPDWYGSSGGANQPLDLYQAFTYGPHGNVLTRRVGNDNAELSESSRGALPTHMTYFPGTETTTYYNASKYFQKASVTDMNGHVTSMDYYDDQDASQGNRGEVKWVRDAGYTDSASPSYQKEFDYAYNQYGQKASETNLNSVVTQYSYGTGGDAWGNLTQVVQDSGDATHLNRTTQMAYDAAGHVLQSTDPSSQTSTFTYNTLGQPLSVSTPAKGSAAAETISYVYGGNGRTESVTDNRGPTAMVYEAGCDRVHSVTDPVTGTTSYTYGARGERASMTLPGGGTFTYTYAPVSPWDSGALRPSTQDSLSSDDPNSLARNLTAITDDQGRKTEYVIDPTGRLRSSRSDETYDNTGALVSYAETDLTFDTANATFGPTPTHFWVKRIATTWHWLETVNGYYPQWRTRLIAANDYTYDNAGQRLTNTITTAATNGNGSPQYTGGTPQYSSTLQADLFQETPYATPVTNQVTTSREEQYGYDANNRLSSVNYGDGGSQSYAFDALGNRLSRTDSASGTTTYAYNAANMLLGTAPNGGSASAYTNDADGNTLSGGGRVNTWDSQNRLVQSIVNGTTSAFKYGADGLRREMTVTPAGGGTATTTDYCLDGQSMVREMQRNSQGVLTPTATYLTGPRGPEYKRSDLDGTVRWYVYDGLGSVVGEVDPNGNLTASTGYDVYGAKRGGLGSATSRHGFVGSLGHQTDSETGLVYMRARYMDVNTGRFISQDGSKNGNNWFVYCADNPVNCVDATGKEVQWWNYATFGLGIMFTSLAVIVATSLDYCKTVKDATATAAEVQGLSGAAILCFAVSMCGVMEAGQEALNVIMTGALFPTLQSVVGGVMAAGKVNQPGVDVAVAAVFTEELVCLAVIATSNGDY